MLTFCLTAQTLYKKDGADRSNNKHFSCVKAIAVTLAKSSSLLSNANTRNLWASVYAEDKIKVDKKTTVLTRIHVVINLDSIVIVLNVIFCEHILKREQL